LVARTVRDVALVLQAAAGPDPRDPHSLPATSESFLKAVEHVPAKRRVIFTTQLGFTETIDPEIVSVCRSAVGAFREFGWEVVERDLAWPDPAPFANVLAAIGLASRLRGLEDRKSDIEPGILDILETVKRMPPNAFYDAYFERNRWCAYAFELFQHIDFLVTPATASPPFELGRSYPETVDGKPGNPSTWSPFLRSFNITGQPAISVPAGRTRGGLPVGLQIVGPRFADADVLSAAAAFERARPWPTEWTLEQLKNPPS